MIWHITWIYAIVNIIVLHCDGWNHKVYLTHHEPWLTNVGKIARNAKICHVPNLKTIWHQGGSKQGRRKYSFHFIYRVQEERNARSFHNWINLLSSLILEFIEKGLIPFHLQFWVFFYTFQIRCNWDLRELIWRMSCITTNRSSLGNKWLSMIGTMYVY